MLNSIMNPKFSIIIPVYNVAPYLRECLDSVLAQICADWEAICVDDGSTDGGGAILDEYSAKDRRITVLHQKNAGVSSARNAGLEVARGEWVMFIDSDDYWDPMLLAKLSDKANSFPNADVVSFAPIVQFYDDGRSVPLARIEPGVVSGQRVLEGCEDVYMGLGWHSVDKMYKRSLVESRHFRFNINVFAGEDALFVNSLFAYAKSVLICDDIKGYYRRMHSGSATQNFSLRMWTSQVERFLSLWKVWQESKNVGVRCVLRRDAFAVFRIGCANGAKHRQECIESLLKSKDFWHIVIPFMIFNGHLKSRSVAVLLTLLPRNGARWLLGRMR